MGTAPSGTPIGDGDPRGLKFDTRSYVSASLVPTYSVARMRVLLKKYSYYRCS